MVLYCDTLRMINCIYECKYKPSEMDNHKKQNILIFMTHSGNYRGCLIICYDVTSITPFSKIISLKSKVVGGELQKSCQKFRLGILSQSNYSKCITKKTAKDGTQHKDTHFPLFLLLLLSPSALLWLHKEGPRVAQALK